MLAGSVRRVVEICTIKKRGGNDAGKDGFNMLDQDCYSCVVWCVVWCSSVWTGTVVFKINYSLLPLSDKRDQLIIQRRGLRSCNPEVEMFNGACEQ